MPRSYRSELVGAFGCPIDENPTGVMMEAGFAMLDLNYRYLTILVDKGQLGAALAGIKAMHFRGINLTIPHKVEVIRYLDELSPAAEIIGAVNTVVIRDGRFWGDNTDGKGFLASLKEAGADPSGRALAIIGAGGAARAIAVECALAGAARVTIVNRTPAPGEELVRLVEERTEASAAFIPWTPGLPIPDRTDIVVNATSLGLYPNVSEIPDLDYDSFTASMTAADVVFNDPNTRFLQSAASRGARTVNGLGMLVNQGALNFKLWTGHDAPREAMVKKLRQEFGL